MRQRCQATFAPRSLSETTADTVGRWTQTMPESAVRLLTTPRFTNGHGPPEIAPSQIHVDAVQRCGASSLGLFRLCGRKTSMRDGDASKQEHRYGANVGVGIYPCHRHERLGRAAELSGVVPGHATKTACVARLASSFQPRLGGMALDCRHVRQLLKLPNSQPRKGLSASLFLSPSHLFSRGCRLKSPRANAASLILPAEREFALRSICAVGSRKDRPKYPVLFRTAKNCPED